ARFLDVNTGRFLSEDPIGFNSGDWNFYRYVGNNVINEIDPIGLKAWYKYLGLGSPKGCDKNDSCPILYLKRTVIDLAIAARAAETIRRMWTGQIYDSGHLWQILQLTIMHDKCSKIIKCKCKSGGGNNSSGSRNPSNANMPNLNPSPILPPILI
ncbi:MAG: YD repeat-containing protein, partial [uncultured bacterium]